MSRPQKQYSEEQKVEIIKAYKDSKNAKEQKRLLCIKLRVCEGYKTKQISEIIGYASTFVDEIISRYNRSGLDEIKIKKQTGNRRNLSRKDEMNFLKTFSKKAESGQQLVVNDIHAEYEKLIGRQVPKSTVYNMLHRNGWRKVMPRPKHPKKASDEAIEAYKKNQ
jgi:transposase